MFKKIIEGFRFIHSKNICHLDIKPENIVFDKNFKALDSRGCRVTKLSDAMSFATREDAQEIIDKKGDPNCIFEVRKAKG